MRIGGAYRTISMEAVLIIARVERKRARLYRTSKENRNYKWERERTRIEWQQRWDQGGKGAWTRKLIPNVRTRVTRKHGEVNSYLTQMLSGQGVFNTYLNAIAKADNENCVYWEEQDDPEHAIFSCNRFVEERITAQRDRGELTATNIIERMLSDTTARRGKKYQKWLKTSCKLER